MEKFQANLTELQENPDTDKDEDIANVIITTSSKKLLTSELITLIAARVLMNFTPLHMSEEYQHGTMSLIGNITSIYSIPLHREYAYTGISCDPIVGETAAKCWVEGKLDVTRIMCHIIASYKTDKGERGELMARVLSILAYDLAGINQHSDNASSSKIPQTIQYNSPVPVMQFLKSLLAKKYHQDLEILKPHDAVKHDLSGEESQTLPIAFKNAFVRFTHFALYNHDGPINCYSAMIAMARGHAMQAWANQAVYDIAIPIFFDDDNGQRKIAPENMSFILIQVKDRVKPVKAPIPEGLQLFPCQENKRPYIFIMMELGLDQPTELMNQTEFNHHVTPSKLTIAAQASRASSRIANKEKGTLKYQHQYYTLGIQGFSDSVYQVAAKRKSRFAFLLSTRSLFDEHYQQGSQNLDAIKQNKPSWSLGRACYNYADIPLLHEKSKPTKAQLKTYEEYSIEAIHGGVAQMETVHFDVDTPHSVQQLGYYESDHSQSSESNEDGGNDENDKDNMDVFASIPISENNM